MLAVTALLAFITESLMAFMVLAGMTKAASILRSMQAKQMSGSPHPDRFDQPPHVFRLAPHVDVIGLLHGGGHALHEVDHALEAPQ